MSNTIEFELEHITDRLLENNNSSHEHIAKEKQDNGNTHEVTEDNQLLPAEQVPLPNGTQEQEACRSSLASVRECVPVNLEESSQHNGQWEPVRWNGCLSPDLNQNVVGQLKLWMVIALVFLVILLVTVLSLVLCSVLYEDPDEKFDPESFVVPRYYTGTLRLVNMDFTEDLLSNTSQQSQVISTKIQEKLSKLYSTSPTLARYFSGAGASAFRNNSVTAHYWLKFLMPQEHSMLVRYTLSREMVCGVLRQHLYDQDTESWDPDYIDPVSVHMEVGNRTMIDQ